MRTARHLALYLFLVVAKVINLGRESMKPRERTHFPPFSPSLSSDWPIGYISELGVILQIHFLIQLVSFFLYVLMTSLLFLIKLLTQKSNSYKACCPGKFAEILLQKTKQIYLLLLDSRKEPLLKKLYPIWNGNNSPKRKDQNSWGGDNSPKKILATNHNGHHYLLSHKKKYLSSI